MNCLNYYFWIFSSFLKNISSSSISCLSSDEKWVRFWLISDSMQTICKKELVSESEITWEGWGVICLPLKSDYSARGSAVLADLHWQDPSLSLWDLWANPSIIFAEVLSEDPFLPLLLSYLDRFLLTSYAYSFLPLTSESSSI